MTFELQSIVTRKKLTIPSKNKYHDFLKIELFRDCELNEQNQLFCRSKWSFSKKISIHAQASVTLWYL